MGFAAFTHRLTPRSLSRWFCLVLALMLPALAIAEEARFSHGILWKIDGKGAPASYLFGTIHVDDDRVLALPPAVRAAFDQADSFAAELLSDDASTRKFLASMITADAELPALVGAAAYPQVDKLLGEHGIPEAARTRFKPWAAMLTLLEPRAGSGLILDRVLQDEAARQKKPIHALETVDQQIAVFDGLPRASQLALLARAVADHAAIQDSTRLMVDAWLAGDLEALWKLDAEAMSGDAAIEAHNAALLERLLYARNARFVRSLVPLLGKGRLFAAFGALHLYGERGVLSLLDKMGYKLERVY